MHTRILTLLFSFLLFCSQSPLVAAGERNAKPGDYVVLVHGLGWIRDSLKETDAYFTTKGYKVIRFVYDSRQPLQPEALCLAMERLIQDKCPDTKKRVHFVAHSMGCIVTRCYLEHHRPANLGQVVLLTPPNKGTELADLVGKSELLQSIFGKGAPALGTKPDSLPNRLPAPNYAPGVLMGDRSILFVTSLLLKGPDDGIIRVERGQIPGLGGFKVLHSSHVFLPGNELALAEMDQFLKTGSFLPEAAPMLSSR